MLILDRGFTDFAQWATWSARGVTWPRRAKSSLKDEVARVLVHTSSVQNRVVRVGQGATRQLVRLIKSQARGTVYRDLSNALDPLDLPTTHAAALYSQRWRVDLLSVTVALAAMLLRRCAKSVCR